MKYVRDPNNRVEWVLYISTAIFIGPFLVSSSNSYQWQFGAVAIYLAWFNYLLFFRRYATAITSKDLFYVCLKSTF